MLAIVLSAVLPAQEPMQDTGSRTRPAAVAAWNAQQARAALGAFRKAVRGKGVPLARRLQALEALARGRHHLLIRPLAKLVVSDPAVTMRRRAARALAVQPPAKARAVLVRLLEHEKVLETPAVLAEVVRALSSTGYVPRDWPGLERLFERDFAAAYVPVQKALLELIAAHREAGAWKLLLRHLDEPRPVDVHSPANPPASYWEKRWKAWRAWRGMVREALYAITGQRFSSAAEARAWAEDNPAKLRPRPARRK